jgi:proline dehydrogenase
VDGTIDAYVRLRERRSNAGLCVQAYLHRTRADLERLLPLGASIRLVKGAYRERREVSLRDRRRIDERFFRLAMAIIERRAEGSRLALGTHDVALVERIERAAGGRGAFEVHMLFGIRSRDQERLARTGYAVRTLIAYGPHWYPWFMRRLAERPVANVLLALRNLGG